MMRHVAPSAANMLLWATSMAVRLGWHTGGLTRRWRFVAALLNYLRPGFLHVFSPVLNDKDIVLFIVLGNLL